MTSFLKFILVVILLAITISCEDSLEPYGELQDFYILNCIIRSDTTFHVATISKSYLPPYGTDPQFDDENSIKGTILRIWNKDQIGIFEDTTVTMSSDSKPYSYYYVNAFQPVENSEITIEAILPSGKKLSAASVVPMKVSFNSSANDATISSATTSMNFAWETMDENAIFNVRFKVYYLQLINNQYISKSFIVPEKYIEEQNKIYSIYSGLTSSKYYQVDINTINRAMKNISGDDPNKFNYSITSAALEVQSLDTALSKYYYSTNRGIDSYSVNLDESDYSNIQGGKGIFGVILRTYWRVRFTREYVEQFGYEAFF